MKWRFWRSAWILAAVLLAGAAMSAPFLLDVGSGDPFETNTWQLMTNPGALSTAHSSLEASCAACHTPFQGATDDRCIQCHAGESTLLLMQPTAFHVNVTTCRACHLEHRGRDAVISTRDHGVFATVAFEELERMGAGGDSGASSLAGRLERWSGQEPGGADTDALESALNCNECHSNKDPHVGYLGSRCASCHATDKWSIPSYTHPSDLSNDCSQCHAPPNAHFSPMFKTMCAEKLGKVGVATRDCYQCHRIISWFEIRGAPWHSEQMGHGYGRIRSLYIPGNDR
jgi:hypothetical protein